MLTRQHMRTTYFFSHFWNQIINFFFFSSKRKKEINKSRVIFRFWSAQTTRNRKLLHFRLRRTTTKSLRNVCKLKFSVKRVFEKQISLIFFFFYCHKLHTAVLGLNFQSRPCPVIISDLIWDCRKTQKPFLALPLSHHSDSSCCLS